MATTTLQRTEQPTMTTSSEVDPMCTGNVGNDIGISTAGYRTGKFSPKEWHAANYNVTYQSTVGRETASQVRNVASDAIKEAEAVTHKLQGNNTKLLAERLHDVNFWKQELKREIGDMISETELLCSQKLRLENALRATEIPLHIATDNLQCRQRRQGIDLVEDDVELNLLKEIEIINNVQDLLQKTIKEADNQIKLNRDRKQSLEMDWSDKKEADELDTKAVILRNEDTNKQFYPEAARFQQIQSTPESWAQFSHDNITRAEHERMASIQLRTLIDNVLHDVSRDMTEQADSVGSVFQRRTVEMNHAKSNLEENLQKVCDDIVAQQKLIADLKKAIKDKEDPLKVAQTRLHHREYRPKVELCRDPPQYGLVDEVYQLRSSVDALTKQLVDAERGLKNLQDHRNAIEKDISIKKNSIFIDNIKAVPHRSRYPTISKLQGYQ
jgi:tektin-4